jgi:hypothetical protein
MMKKQLLLQQVGILLVRRTEQEMLVLLGQNLKERH